MTTRKSSDSLFREEFLEQQSQGIFGEVWLGAPSAIKWFALSIICVVLCTVVFAATVDFPKHERVNGWLVHNGGIVRAVSRNGGVITSIEVEEGQAVEKGQVLARLSLTTEISSGNVGNTLRDATNIELESANREHVATISLLEAEKDSIYRQQQFLKKEIENKLQLSINLKSREKLMHSEFDRIRSLVASGYLTSTAIDSKKGDLLLLEQSTLENFNAINSIESKLTELTDRALSIPRKIAELNAKSNAQKAAFTQKFIQLEAQASEVMTAPIAGVVAALPVAIGQSLAPGGAVALMTPRGQQLEAELFLPSRSIGFIRHDQLVSIYYQAFPYQRYGTGKGKVASISKTVLSPAEVSMPGQSLAEPVFRVRVRLSSQKIKAYNEDIPLQSGMLLNANVVLARRSLFDILMDPLMAVRERS